MDTKQQASLVPAQKAHLELGIESFLAARKAVNLTPGTTEYCLEKLSDFITDCTSPEIKLVSQITAHAIFTQFLLGAF